MGRQLQLNLCWMDQLETQKLDDSVLCAIKILRLTKVDILYFLPAQNTQIRLEILCHIPSLSSKSYDF